MQHFSPGLYRVMRLAALVGVPLYLSRLVVEGREHVPVAGPVILAPNHPSQADPFLLGHVLAQESGRLKGRPLHFMAKQELFANHLLGGFLSMLGAYPVNRRKADDETILYTKRLLRDGNAVVIFPEGGCTENGSLREFKPGVARFSLDHFVECGGRLPLVPVGIMYGRMVRDYGPAFGSTARICFAEPVPLEGYAARYRDACPEDRKAVVRELTASVRCRLETVLTRLSDCVVTEGSA